MELMRRSLRYDGNRIFDLYHLCYYFSNPAFRNADRRLVLDFKNEEEYALRFFILEALQNIQHIRLDDDLVILRALSSKETRIKFQNQPLDRLGESIARVFDYTYYPLLLTKTRETSAIKSLTPAERKAELASVYKTDANVLNFNHRNVLLIDDVVTTGTTACAIIRSILNEFPYAKATVFALAWTPTQQQQAYLREQESKPMVASEPEADYGKPGVQRWKDEDFEKGETAISVYPA